MFGSVRTIFTAWKHASVVVMPHSGPVGRTIGIKSDHWCIYAVALVRGACFSFVEKNIRYSTKVVLIGNVRTKFSQQVRSRSDPVKQAIGFVSAPYCRISGPVGVVHEEEAF